MDSFICQKCSAKVPLTMPISTCPGCERKYDAVDIEWAINVTPRKD